MPVISGELEEKVKWRIYENNSHTFCILFTNNLYYIRNLFRTKQKLINLVELTNLSEYSFILS